MEMLFIFLGISWIAGCLIYFFIRDRKQKKVSEPLNNTALQTQEVIDYPRILKVSVVHSDDEIAADILCDLVIRMDDLIAGTYTLPDKLKNKYTPKTEITETTYTTEVSDYENTNQGNTVHDDYEESENIFDENSLPDNIFDADDFSSEDAPEDNSESKINSDYITSDDYQSDF
jgi:hypothetical protein